MDVNLTNVKVRFWWRICILVFSAGALLAQAPDTWTSKELLSAADVATRLRAGEKPLIIYVGPAYLFRTKHIPDSLNAGMASKPEGIEKLLAQMKGKSLNTEVIIYCGCCPMRVCPNIRPAIKALKDAGFKNVRLLELPTRFDDDWVTKGYPTKSNHAP